MIFCILVINSNLFSQTRLNNIEVLGTDSITKQCWPIYFDSRFQLDPIAQSTKQIEIRLYELDGPQIKCKILWFDGNTWNGRVALPLFADDNETTTLNRHLDLDSILDSLVQNRIFTLPDQRLLSLDGWVTDGVQYCISYKIFNKYRSYDFANPDIFYTVFEKNRSVKELVSYISIIRIFGKLF